MKCFYCKQRIHEENFDWGYMYIGESLVQFAHLVCVEYDAAMERIEVEAYLLERLTF